MRLLLVCLFMAITCAAFGLDAEQAPEYSSSDKTFYDRVFNYRTRHDCFVTVIVYHRDDTLKYVVENHALYDYMRSSNRQGLDYNAYQAFMEETLKKQQGIVVHSPLDELQAKWHFRKVEASPEVDMIAGYGKQTFIEHFFKGSALKEGVSQQDQNAIINQLFQWSIATQTDDETGCLIIPERLSNARGNLIEHVCVPYFVGDINEDKQGDTAYVVYDRSLKADSAIEKECLNKNCEITIKFNRPIPDLVIGQSLGIYVQKAEDLNNDKANELILFSEWFEGYWCQVCVWSFKHGQWKEIARTRAFLAENEDYRSRIKKINGQFYLIGDSWNDRKGGLVKRCVKVRIEQ